MKNLLSQFNPLAYFSLAAAGSAALSMSTLFSAMKPVLLTRFVEQVNLAETLAGLTVAMPFVGIACASLCMTSYITNAPYKRIVVIFGSLLIGLELLSAWSFHLLSIILTAQFASGICVGILMGTTSRLIATTKNPDQLFGIADMIAVLLMSFMVYGVGVSVEVTGLSGGYLFAAVIAACFMCIMLIYRQPAEAPQSKHQPSELFVVGWRQLIIVAMGVLFVTCSGLGFAFMFSMAKTLGMSYDSAGGTIGILLFLSAFACLAGGWASAKFGPERPIAIACTTCAIGWWLAVHATNTNVFLFALIPAVFSLQFNFPILLALCGSLDAQGKWASIATPLLTSGFAWAAILAGQIVSRLGIEALAPATAIGMAVCIGMLWISHQMSLRSPVKSN